MAFFVECPLSLLAIVRAQQCKASRCLVCHHACLQATGPAALSESVEHNTHLVVLMR